MLRRYAGLPFFAGNSMRASCMPVLVITPVVCVGFGYSYITVLTVLRFVDCVVTGVAT
jgi:hypothetical protein